MAGIDDMQMPTRSPTWKQWNLNTLISLGQFVMLIGGLGYIYANTTRDIQDLQVWRTSHEEYHKERLGETRAKEASFNERLRAEEMRGNEVDRKLDNLAYRVTVAEQSAVSISSSIKDQQAIMNKFTADLQVVKEILQRMEAQQQGRSR